jgi:hypothetical protein
MPCCDNTQLPIPLHSVITTHNSLYHCTLSQQHTTPYITALCHNNTQLPISLQSLRSNFSLLYNPHQNSKLPVMRLPPSVRPLRLPAAWTSFLRKINGVISASYSSSSSCPPPLSSSSFCFLFQPVRNAIFSRAAVSLTGQFTLHLTMRHFLKS